MQHLLYALNVKIFFPYFKGMDRIYAYFSMRLGLCRSLLAAASTIHFFEND